jgi:type I restriction enzyme S subunit
MSEWVSDQLGHLVSFQKGKKVDTSIYRLAGYRRYLGAGSLSGKHGGYASTHLSVQANRNDVLMLWDGGFLHCIQIDAK